MKHLTRRALALCCAALLCAGSLTACKDGKSSSIVESEIDIAMEDMEYGATLRTDRGGYNLPLQFDKRFFNEKALTTLANYYYSIQTNDVEMFRSVQQPLYLDYVINQVNQNRFTDTELVQKSHDTWVERMKGDYAYALVYAKECLEKDDVISNIPTFLAMLDDAAELAGKGKISSEVTNVYELKIDLYLTEAGSGEIGEVGTLVGDNPLFMYEYEGEWYVLY